MLNKVMVAFAADLLGRLCRQQSFVGRTVHRMVRRDATEQHELVSDHQRCNGTDIRTGHQQQRAVVLRPDRARQRDQL